MIYFFRKLLAATILIVKRFSKDDPRKISQIFVLVSAVKKNDWVKQILRQLIEKMGFRRPHSLCRSNQLCCECQKLKTWLQGYWGGISKVKKLFTEEGGNHDDFILISLNQPKLIARLRNDALFVLGQQTELVSEMKIWFSEVVCNFKIKSIQMHILFVSFHSSVFTRQDRL